MIFNIYVLIGFPLAILSNALQAWGSTCFQKKFLFSFKENEQTLRRFTLQGYIILGLGYLIGIYPGWFLPYSTTFLETLQIPVTHFISAYSLHMHFSSKKRYYVFLICILNFLLLFVGKIHNDDVEGNELFLGLKQWYRQLFLWVLYGSHIPLVIYVLFRTPSAIHLRSLYNYLAPLTIGIFNAGFNLYLSMIANSVLFLGKFSWIFHWKHILFLVLYVKAVIYLDSVVYNFTPLNNTVVINTVTYSSINVLAGVVIFQERIQHLLLFWILFIALFTFSCLYLQETSEDEIRRDLQIRLKE